MNILVFAFNGTVAEKIAKKLKTPIELSLINSALEAIDEFAGSAEIDKYDFVLGMGAYSGRDSDALRIEAQCSSHFRNNKDNLQKMQIPYFLRPSEGGVKLATGIGTSWCNLVSYKLLKAHPKANYTFIHVPKLYPVNNGVKIIDQQLTHLVK